MSKIRLTADLLIDVKGTSIGPAVDIVFRHLATRTDLALAFIQEDPAELLGAEPNIILDAHGRVVGGTGIEPEL